MCELFGVSASHPIRMRYSLHAFAEHGGLLHPNKSGWGIAYREGLDGVLLKEPAPAAESPWIDFVSRHPIQSDCVIAHVRYATAGEPSYANTHPFTRELGGRTHFFAHNGSMKDIRTRLPLSGDRFRTVGETDSEHAFCYLLGRLAPLWRPADARPSLEERLDAVAQAAGELAKLGPANFLYSDGHTLFAHAHKRCWDEGDGRFSEPRPPGLSVGVLEDILTKGLHVEKTHSDARMTFVASVPLTEDGWKPLPEGTVIALENGREIGRRLRAS